MQIFFFLGLIGIIFSSMTFINASLTITAMEKKLEQVENVKELLEDTKIAILDGILSSRLDLRAMEDSLNTLEFVSPYVKWNNEELLRDPWGNPYRIMTAVDSEIPLYATPSTEIRAYVTAFSIVSAGPDGKFGQAVPTPDANITYNYVRSYTPPNTGEGEDGEDDIFTTFTTYPAALKMWGRVFSVLEKIKVVAANNYGEQFDKFRPAIEAYYETNPDAHGTNVSGDEWRNVAALQAQSAPPFFPRMETSLVSLGLQEEVADLPDVFNIRLENPTSDGLEVDLRMTAPIVDENHGWTVNFLDKVRGVE